MGQDLIGESGIEAARNFLKLSSKSGGQSLGDFSEEDEHHKALSSESLDDGLDYSDTCSTSSTSSAANKIRRGSSARSENRSSLPDITSVNSEEEEEDEEEDEKGDKTQRPIYVNKIEEQKTIPLLNHAGHKSSLSHAEQFDYFCKVILVGDSGVGKTCLLMKYKDGAFLSGSYISTVGIDFRNKVISVDDSKVKLQIWDTAGQERFRSVTHAYYRDAHALLLLYDVSSRTSFDNTREWLAEVHEYAQDDVVIMLIGNKCDIPTSERQIRREDGERLAREYNVAFMETSAKTGINVDLAFTAVARDLKARKSSNALGNKFNVAEYIEKQEKIDHCLCSIF